MSIEVEDQTLETSANNQNAAFSIADFLTQRNELKNQIETLFESLEKKPKFNRKDTLRVMHRVTQLVNHLDSLSEIILKDLMIIDQRFNQVEQHIFSIANNHTVLKSVLEDKNLVTTDELKATWVDKVKPELEKKIAAAKAEVENPTNVSTETSSGLVDSTGQPL